MCEECEEAEPLREAYLARRARMARTWTRHRLWMVDAPAPVTVSDAPHPDAGQMLTAAE